MTIKRMTNIDYEGLCDELGITVEELVTLVKSKDKESTKVKKQIQITVVIDEFMANILQLNSINRRSHQTVTTYINFLGRLKNHIEKIYPELNISEMNEDIFFEVIQNGIPRKSENLAVNTINKYLAILRSMFSFAYDRGYLTKDIRYKFPIQKVTTLPRYLNDTQIDQVLRAALQKSYGYRKRAMLIFLLGTGCRISELTQMKVCDFNVNENLILIRNGKGNKDRYVPMFNEIKVAILHYLKISGISEWDIELNGYLFSSQEGIEREKKISNRSIQALVRDLFDNIHLDRDFTVHSLRHTFAVKCLKSGMKLQYLMQILGHEDPKTTAIYTQLLPLDLKEEVMKHYPFPFEKLLKELF